VIKINEFMSFEAYPTHPGMILSEAMYVREIADPSTTKT